MAIGSDIKRKEAREKVTGAAKYTADFAEPGLLHAVLVTSPHSHARIISIDKSGALQSPGVFAVVTGDEYPQLSGTTLYDRPSLAVRKARYCGEPVAMVVADEEYHAYCAARLVSVQYEKLPPVPSPSQAVAPGAPVIHENLKDYCKEIEDLYPEPGTNVITTVRIRKGDMPAAWRRSNIIVEGYFTLPQSDHIAMETRCAEARILPGGQVVIRSATQAPFAVKKLLARVFNLEEGLVSVRAPFVGGGFGGKAPVQLELLAYIASKAAGGRPVRIANPREHDIMTSPCRVGSESTLRFGVSPDGLLQAVEMTHLIDAGAYADISPRIATAVAVDCSGPYNMPNLSCDAVCVYTNHTYATSYRGFGHMTATFCVERMMDKAAGALGMDPLAFRQKNLLHSGHYNPTQVKVTASNTGDIPACFEKLREAVNWQEGPVVDLGNGKLRSKGIGSCYKTSDSPPDAISGAIITFNTDGSPNLNIGSVEIGPGIKTAAAQILAESLKIDVNRVHVNMDVDTQVNPRHWKTVASMTTFMNGRSIVMAAEDVKRQLLSVAALAMKCPPADLEIAGGRVYLRDDPDIFIDFKDIVHGFQYPDGVTVEGQVIGRGTYVMRHVSRLDRETGKGKPGPYWTPGAQAVEIEYDTKDCTYRLLRAVTVIDAGRVINPMTARGLVTGAMCMGLGVGSREAFHYNAEGGINNSSLRTYKIMHYGEQPVYDVRFVETPCIPSPFGARGLAEHGIIGMPAALANALTRAAGVEIDRLPATPELIWNLRGGAAVDPF